MPICDLISILGLCLNQSEWESVSCTKDIKKGETVVCAVYQEQELVRIAKRQNNKKRNYLVVNPLQGKHIPVSPHKALNMFRALAEPLKEPYAKQRLLLIGFAETATAIGAAVAVELGALYMQTTREQLSGVEYLYFSEEHSHATEQKLVKNDLDLIMDEIDRIIFIEDEVTTGKTILNSIEILERNYPNKVQYAVASLLNGMDEEALKRYQNKGIALHWLAKTNHAIYPQIAEAYQSDGEYKVCSTHDLFCEQSEKSAEISCKEVQKNQTDVCISPQALCAHQTVQDIHIRKLHIEQPVNTRRLIETKSYVEFCQGLYDKIIDQMDLSQQGNNILVLGTEEYMYPPLYIAGELEKQGKNVRFHATTRSPITVSRQEKYPLHTRYELKSFYDSQRITYIYDLEKYDCVLILTDAPQENVEGFWSLMDALVQSGNDNIVLVN